MSPKDDIEKLIAEKHRRLQKLKEQQAKFGLHTPPHILTEIEDIEAEMAELNIKLSSEEVQKPATTTWDDKTPPDSKLELVDVTLIEIEKEALDGVELIFGGEAVVIVPVIDVKVVNRGKSVAILKRAEFEVKKIWEPNFIEPPGMLHPSWNYDVMLPVKETPYSESVNISQAIKPDEPDRFTFTISGNCYFNSIFLVRLKLVYDEDNKYLESPDLMFLVRGEFPTAKLRWAIENQRIFEEVTTVKATLSKELDDFLEELTSLDTYIPTRNLHSPVPKSLSIFHSLKILALMTFVELWGYLRKGRMFSLYKDRDRFLQIFRAGRSICLTPIKKDRKLRELKELADAVEKGILLLEANEYETFIREHASPDDLKEMLKNQLFEDFVREFSLVLTNSVAIGF